ncbi:MAG: DUF1351 domain-containing protein [Coriobacteriia bacterium]|nr:DUF1351 domain-containing protein [Coriobacteriia bacterium]
MEAVNDTEVIEAEVIDNEKVEPSSELHIISYNPGSEVVGNFAALKLYAEEQADKYLESTKEIVDEESYKLAKKNRTQINRLSKQLNSERLAVKRKYLEPIEAFDAMVKEIDSPLKFASEQIKEGLAAYDKKFAHERYQLFEAEYKENAELLADQVPFKMIWQDSYGNRSVTEDKARESIVNEFRRIRGDIDTIDAMNYSDEERIELKGFYFGNLDMNKALTAFNEQRQAKEHAKRMEEELSYPEQAKQAVLEASDTRLNQQHEQTTTTQTKAPEKALERFTWHIIFEGTLEDAKAVAQELKLAGYTGKIVKEQ